MECVYIEEAYYIEDYKVFIRFNTGKSGEVNLQDIIFKYDIAKPLRELNEFANFSLEIHGLLFVGRVALILLQKHYMICVHSLFVSNKRNCW